MNKFHAKQLVKNIKHQLDLGDEDDVPEWAIKLAMRAYREGWEDGYDRASSTRILE